MVTKESIFNNRLWSVYFFLSIYYGLEFYTKIYSCYLLWLVQATDEDMGWLPDTTGSTFKFRLLESSKIHEGCPSLSGVYAG